MGNVKYDEIKRFRDQIEKNLSGVALIQFIEDCSKELAARLLAKVIKRTPVGQKPKLQGKKAVKVTGSSGKQKTFLTAEAARLQQYWGGYQGGTLRRGWTAGKNMDARAYADSLNITRAGNKVYVIEVVNPVEYASYVEFGHRQTPGRYVPAIGKKLKNSWVEGKFMLTISEDEIQRDAQGIIQNKLEKKLGEILK